MNEGEELLITLGAMGTFHDAYHRSVTKDEVYLLYVPDEDALDECLTLMRKTQTMMGPVSVRVIVDEHGGKIRVRFQAFADEDWDDDYPVFTVSDIRQVPEGEHNGSTHH